MGGYFIFNLFVAVIFDEVIRSVEYLKAMEQSKTQAIEHKKSDSLPPAGPAGPILGPPDPHATPMQEAPMLTLTDGYAGGLEAGTLHGAGAAAETDGASASDCCGFERALRPVGYVTTSVIAFNIALMCAPYKGMSFEYAERLRLGAQTCTLYFVCEILLKLCVYGHGNPCSGWAQFWTVRDDRVWNRLDFTVVVVDIGSSLIEGILAAFGGGNTHVAMLRILRVFRALRVLRAFKLSNVWGALNNTIRTIYNGSAPVASLAILILLFTMMYALLGKELFGGLGLSAHTRWHFDSAQAGLITTMTIFSGEVCLPGPAWRGAPHIYSVLPPHVPLTSHRPP